MIRRFLFPILSGPLALMLVSCGGGDMPPAPSPTATPTTAPPSASVESTAPPPPVAERVVEVLNKDPGGSGEYIFEPAEMNFKVGQTITFEMIAETELHSFTVDELGIDVDIDGSTSPGQTETLIYTFDKPGKFRLVCIYHEGNGMVGEITVQ